MSYDLAVWEARSRPREERALEIYEALCDGQPPRSLRKPSAAVDELLQALVAEFPTLEEASDDEVDSCVWSVDPERGGSFILLNLVHSRANLVLARVLQLAARYPLVCFDPQEGIVYFGETEPLEPETEEPVFQEAPELEACEHLAPFLALLDAWGCAVAHKVHGRSWGDAFLVTGTIPFNALAELSPPEPIRLDPEHRCFGCAEHWQSIAELGAYGEGWP